MISRLEIVFFVCVLKVLTFVVTEPTQVPNHTVLNHVTPVNEDAKSSNEGSHPLNNGQVLVAEKAVATDPPVVASHDAHPAKEAAASKNEEEAPKKSFASVVRTIVLDFSV